jgi:hypothetical protein
MSTFQWAVLTGLALVVLQLFYAVKVLAAVAQILEEAALEKERDPHLEEAKLMVAYEPERASLFDVLSRIASGLAKIAEQTERLAGCYARATRDAVEEASQKQRADEAARLRGHIDAGASRLDQEAEAQGRGRNELESDS